MTLNSKLSNEPILDNSVIEDLKSLDQGDGASIITELGRMFLDAAPLQIQVIRKAAESGDLRQVRSEAHSLKSSAGNLGALRLSAVCQSLEHEMDARLVAKWVGELEAQWTLLKQALEGEMKKAA